MITWIKKEGEDYKETAFHGSFPIGFIDKAKTSINWECVNYFPSFTATADYTQSGAKEIVERNFYEFFYRFNSGKIPGSNVRFKTLKRLYRDTIAYNREEIFSLEDFPELLSDGILLHTGMNYHLTDKGKQLMKKYKGVLENMIDKWDSYN